MNSSGQIDQLNALRCKMQPGKFNLSRSESEEILENEMPGIRKEIQKEETYNKYGGDASKVEIDAIEKHGTFERMHFSAIPEGSLIEGRFVYTVENKPISAGAPKPVPIFGENR